MRAVSCEDRLTERGANPRTGLVSPYIIKNGSNERDHDGYMRPLTVTTQEKKRESSGRWKQNDVGWRIVEDLEPDPSIQIMTHTPSQIQGGTADPDSVHLRDHRSQNHVTEEIKCEYIAMSELTPLLTMCSRLAIEGLSSPSNRPQQIPRKLVRSGHHVGWLAESLAARKQARVSTVLATMKINQDSRKRSPLCSPRPVPLERPSPAYCKQDFVSDSLSSDPLARKTTPQTSTLEPEHDLLLQGPCHLENPRNGISTPNCRCLPPLSSQRIAQLPFLDPFDFANLGLSYRRPAELLPTRLKCQRKVDSLKDPHASNDNATSMKQQVQRRPRLKRENGATELPQMRKDTRYGDRHLHSECGSLSKAPSRNRRHDSTQRATVSTTKSVINSEKGCEGQDATQETPLFTGKTDPCSCRKCDLPKRTQIISPDQCH